MPESAHDGTPLATHAPGSIDWRILVAQHAFSFFSTIHNPAIGDMIGKPVKVGQTYPWSADDFAKFLPKIGLEAGGAREITRILGAMERAGFLLAAGWDTSKPWLGQLYFSNDFASAQTNGFLWLSEVLGAELIIPSYTPVTVQITGGDSVPWGTGLVLDRSHVITNRHVTDALTGRKIEIYSYLPNAAEGRETRQLRVVRHPDLDVAVIEAQPPEREHFVPLRGMTFRDPKWADEVYLFGYPRVPMTADMHVTVQRGEVVNPSAQTIPDRHRIFLYSAIARPGNSGGPIVAHDGRVIGLVVEDAAESQSTSTSHRDDAPPAAPFYRGIPSGEVLRALGELGFSNLLIFENDV